MNVGLRLLGAGCVFIGGYLVGAIVADEDFRRRSDFWGYGLVLALVWAGLGVRALTW